MAIDKDNMLLLNNAESIESDDESMEKYDIINKYKELEKQCDAVIRKIKMKKLVLIKK